MLKQIIESVIEECTDKLLYSLDVSPYYKEALIKLTLDIVKLPDVYSSEYRGRKVDLRHEYEIHEIENHTKFGTFTFSVRIYYRQKPTIFTTY